MKPSHPVTLILALAIDLLWGDPPNKLHPVAWMGTLIAKMQQYRPHGDSVKEFGFGTLLTLSGAALVARLGAIAIKLLSIFPKPFAILMEGVLLKTTFSLRGLWQASADVEAALHRGDLPEARRLLSWHLVSRDTTELSESEVAAATIESVAENSSDGTVAPLLAYAFGGLPLALAYRFVNTCDAMLGYRDPAREWFGKFPARLDDVLNFIPARLSGWLVVMTAPLVGGNSQQAQSVMLRDRHVTDSPNAGYPMAAMAGALDVELEKTEQYKLGAGLPKPKPSDISRSRQLLLAVGGFASLLFVPLVVKRGRPMMNHRASK